MKKLTNNTIGVLLLLFVISVFGCKEDEITNISAETLVIDQTEVTLDPGDSLLLTATITPGNAGNKAVFWKSSSARIAPITDAGWVKAERPGVATITAIAYSNADIRNTVTVTVTGIPDDVVSGVVGTYTGDLVIGALSYSKPTELTLQQEDFYSVRLITSVDLRGVQGVDAVVPIDILTGVDRDGDGFKISGEGTTAIGLVTINGTVDADGNIELEIYVAAFDATATYSGKNTANIEEIVTGTYVGNITMEGAGPIGSGIEVDITRVNNQYQLHIDTTVMGNLLTTTIEITVLRSEDIYTISSNVGTSTLGPITVTSGTITANGSINFVLEMPGLATLPGPPPSTSVTYSGQKLEKLANAVAGTYEGVVTLNSSAISAADAEITLAVVDRTTVLWTTSTPITLPPPYGAQTFTITENDNFRLTVSGSSGTYTLTGSGSSILGSVTVTSDSKVEGDKISLTMDAGLSIPLIYTGQKQ